MSTTDYICDTEKIAAFIEGDLETDDRLALERHIAHCNRCTFELQSQQRFVWELESALSNAEDVSVPRNFAKVVAIRAESDMSGLRNASEHKKALRLCLILALAAFALLGVSATKSVFVDAQSILNKGFAFFGLLGKAAYDALVGLGVVVRVLGGSIFSDSRLAGLTALLFVALAIGLLTLLISRYHRTRLSE